jgi:hypothetical protein
MPKLPPGRPPAGQPNITIGASILANQVLSKNTGPGAMPVKKGKR